jgi:hypothetical protein
VSAVPQALSTPEPLPPSALASPTEQPLALFDSNVGYIDDALPGNQLRLRYDAAYRNVRPVRAEFFYARSAPAGPGLPRPDSRVDYQDLSAYLELAPLPHLSAFVETPVRFLNPEINANAAGLADMNVGGKFAVLATQDTVATLQLRTYIPSGDARKGLGTSHVSLEPALLVNQRWTDRVRLEGEFRYWVPIGGTEFAGDVLRYGIGVSYGSHPPDSLWVNPVGEVVGWTVLSGKNLAVIEPAGIAKVNDAAGETIVNVKLGMRMGYGERADLYAGYGRALTGDTWYKDTVRVEFRLHF